MDEHKRAWKEMYDQEEMRPFYYNQVTGEIRWRKPQALLDLMRRPLCTNCEFYEAAVECQHCCEFYCNQCWDQVGPRPSTPTQPYFSPPCSVVQPITVPPIVPHPGPLRWQATQPQVPVTV